MKGGWGVITPLGHLRRGGGSISALRVRGTLPKVIPEGRPPDPPPTPLIYWVILALRVTGTSHSPLSAG